MVIRREFREMLLVVRWKVYSSVCASDWMLYSLLLMQAKTATVMWGRSASLRRATREDYRRKCHANMGLT